MQHRYFIAGTDTEIGKTLVGQSLLYLANQKGLTTAALKPIAAGCQKTPEGWRNEDALALQRMMTASLSYEQVNPIALPAAVAPHIAAAEEGLRLSVENLQHACAPSLQAGYEFMVVEGAGGWRVPLGPYESLADLAIALKLPVVLVVGLRLGCINHALLTAEAIAADGLPLVAWVANQVDETMPRVEENLASLARRFKAPCLGYIPYLHKAEATHAAKYLDIDKLLN